MIEYRTLCALLLGAWLGASILTDLAVTQNFQTIDRFLRPQGGAGTSAQLNEIGPVRERVILRRNAAEENNWIFLNWERVEFVLGAALFLLLLSGASPPKISLVLSLVLLGIVGVQHLLLTPSITNLGRVVDDLPATDPQYRKFWMLHGFYSGLEILKMVAMFVFAVRLAIRQKAGREVFTREYASSRPDTAVIQGNVRRG